MRGKLGLFTAEGGDLELAHALLKVMHENTADFTLTFRRLCDAALDKSADADVRNLFSDPKTYDQWALTWRSRLKRESHTPLERAQAMRKVNPALIPRNHIVERVLKAAADHGDFSGFEAFLDALSRPYEDRPGAAAYAEPPASSERIFQTFCGT